jgi:hypothetical protein
VGHHHRFPGCFPQSLSGFGSALVAMALLPGLMASGWPPLVAAMAMTVEGCLLLRYRAALNLRAVWRLVSRRWLASRWAC